jgi:hyperosmotically inducible protein
MNKPVGFIFFAAAVAATMVVGACSKPTESVGTMPAASSAPGNVADIDETALQQNDALKGFNIGVETLKGDVRLTGVVDNPAQIDEALKIARAADGAHAVHDELTVKK